MGAMRIDLPDPSLVVLVGAAGAGKSTFAARHFRPDEVLSSDVFRARIAGDPADQSVTRPAFAALHRALAWRLEERRLTVVDATNVTRAARLELIRRARVAALPAIAIVLDLPAELVHARNLGRDVAGAAVPAAAVGRQLAQLADSLLPGGLDGEGFRTVVRLTDPATVDRVTIHRQRLRASRGR